MSTALSDKVRAKCTSVYRPELDTLRFLAFLSVFAFHTAVYPLEFFRKHNVPSGLAAALNGPLSGGKFGVDLFFVLSAYLITDLLLREKELSGSLNVRFFYMRRILRIWPLYYFVVLFLGILPIFDSAHAFRNTYMLPFVSLSGNWAFVRFGGPESAAASPLWSVSIEEQFYLFWPPVVARFSRRQILWAACGLAAIANVSRIVVVAMRFGSMAMWANTFTHLDSIAAGILIAVLLGGKTPSLRPIARIILLVTGIVCISLRGYILYAKDDAVSPLLTLIEWPAVALSCAMIVVAFIGVDLKLPWLQYLGKISYGLYVYHLFGVAITEKILSAQGAIPAHSLAHVCLREALAFSITVAMAATSYALLEKPFLNLKNRFAVIHSRPV